MNLRTVYTAATRHAALQRISPECFAHKQHVFMILREALRNFGLFQQVKKYSSITPASEFFRLRRMRHFRFYCHSSKGGTDECAQNENTKPTDG